jgi:hypothetical protein
MDDTAADEHRYWWFNGRLLVWALNSTWKWYKVNVKLTDVYIIKTCKEINIGEELFLDYNRSLYCGKFLQDSDFFTYIQDAYEMHGSW